MHFAKNEEAILQFWNDHNIFQKSLDESRKLKKFTFYDGPPFATGLPHYGHIVASTIKDIIPRYKTQTGHYVPRVFGWDTHGLPIEFEIEKDLGIKTKQDVLDMGIANYNEECRKIVMRYSNEWKKTIDRLGRWVDFENGYKTMDLPFMESVWWVFKQLFEKGMVYHGVKVMPYSTACNTPLSNFESKSNYQNVSDPSITVKFRLIDDSSDVNRNLLVWTTTPWTLPSNLLLCVNPDMEYIEISLCNINYIIAKSAIDRYSKLYGPIIKKYKGRDLLNLEYEPLFPYFIGKYNNSFRIVNDDYVTPDNGTGIVHIAPAFGEDDYRIAMKDGIISKTNLPPCPIDANGHFTNVISDFAEIGVKNADKGIIAKLKSDGKLFEAKYEYHEYPFCWRSNTPLIYRSVPCWFVNVENIHDRIIETNSQTKWIPAHIRDGRFGSWLKDCRDWCVSRNRFWGTPIPLWTNKDLSEVVCIGSVEELETLANLPRGSVKDLHRHYVDQIKIPSMKNKGTYLTRIEEVFDCWFESGAMPYASVHYPFEHSADFLSEMFPGDFIGEGLDQTRGWFYTLMVLSTALFDKPAFKNVIVNGLVLASDGEKMSKSKKNYPDPNLILDKYGSDALRLYLISTPIVRADPMKFNEKGIKDILRTVHIFIENVLTFLKQMISYYEKNYSTQFKCIDAEQLSAKDLNIFDKMILNYMQDFINSVHEEMDKYQLYNIGSRIQDYIDKISRWYLNLNKNRFKSIDPSDQEDVRTCLSVLALNLKVYATMTAPFAPFLAEYIYQTLGKYINLDKQSVHLEQMPRVLWETDKSMVNAITAVENIVETSRKIRKEKSISSFKMPIPYMRISIKYPEIARVIENATSQLSEECNVLNLEVSDEYFDYVIRKVKLNTKTVGPKYKGESRYINCCIENSQPHILDQFLQDIEEKGEVEFYGFRLTKDDIYVVEDLCKSYNKDDSRIIVKDDQIVIYAETHKTPEIENIYQIKRFVHYIQELRKCEGLIPTDDISVYYDSQSERFTNFITMNRENLQNKLRSNIYPELLKSSEKTYEYDEEIINVEIRYPL